MNEPNHPENKKSRRWFFSGTIFSIARPKGLGFGLFGLAAFHRHCDMGHGGGVGGAVPMVLTGGDENHISFGYGQRLIVISHSAGAFGDNQDLVAGMLVELVPRS